MEKEEVNNDNIIDMREPVTPPGMTARQKAAVVIMISGTAAALTSTAVYILTGAASETADAFGKLGAIAAGIGLLINKNAGKEK